MKKPKKVKKSKVAESRKSSTNAWKEEWEKWYEKSRKGGRFIWEDGIC